MFAYTLQRLLYVIPVAFGVSVICFMLVHIAPGDPLTAAPNLRMDEFTSKDLAARKQVTHTNSH